jgi:hypothetical protein
VVTCELPKDISVLNQSLLDRSSHYKLIAATRLSIFQRLGGTVLIVALYVASSWLKKKTQQNRFSVKYACTLH